MSKKGTLGNDYICCRIPPVGGISYINKIMKGFEGKDSNIT